MKGSERKHIAYNVHFLKKKDVFLQSAVSQQNMAKSYLHLKTTYMYIYKLREYLSKDRDK